jgi:glycerophosphoryl diester phosphodiesterase
MTPAIRTILLGAPRLSLRRYGPSNPLYIAHRGGALVYPEETTEGYRASLAAGNVVQEMDVQALSDGALAVMHDTTVDRTTTGTGNVSALNTAGWKALAIDANTWHGSNYGNALVPPLFSELLNEYRGRVIFVPEIKATDAKQTLVDALLQAGIRRDQALVQSFTLTDLAPAIAAGYPALYLTGTATAQEIADARAAGVAWIGLSGAEASYQAWVAAGFKVASWTINRRWVRNYYRGYGASGFFTDDAQYLSADQPIDTSDRFSLQTWMPGMHARDDTLVAAERGQFVAPDMWGFPSGGGFSSVLQGWACPIKGSANADNFSVDLTVKYPAASSENNWASVFFQKDDAAFNDGAAPSVNTQGFHYLMRKTGTIQIYKRTTSAVTEVAIAAGAAIANDTEASFRITVSPTAVSLYRLDGPGGAVVNTATVAATDAAFKGGYMHLCRNGGMGVNFRAISIT